VGDSGSDSNIRISPQREVVMRARAVFTVFARKMASGRRIYYYQTYDEKGFRTPPYSTGQGTKTAAAAFCMEFYRAGRFMERSPGRRQKLIGLKFLFFIKSPVYIFIQYTYPQTLPYRIRCISLYLVCNYKIHKKSAYIGMVYAL
jgi:hypothetical protein